MIFEGIEQSPCTCIDDERLDRPALRIERKASGTPSLVTRAESTPTITAWVQGPFYPRHLAGGGLVNGCFAGPRPACGATATLYVKRIANGTL